MGGQGNQQRRAPRGGAPAHADQGQQRQRERASLAERAGEIIGAVSSRRAEIEAVMPYSIPFERFQAQLATALRHNPDILRCTTASIVQGCVKAAYDGLNLDGVEAALVPQNTKITKRGEPDRWELQARYNPMVRGLRKQIIQGGLVDDVVVTLVYEGEPYRVVRGSNPSIEHEEILEKRGPGRKIVAVYSMAWLKNGRITFETMSRADVDAVRAMAATDYVWNKNEGEMTRKTCLRRHRKSLPGTQEIRDAEMRVLFPQFDSDRPADALPAPARPRREDFKPAQLAPPDVTINDFGTFDARAEEVFAERDQGGEETNEKAAEKAKSTGTDAESSKPPAEGEDENRERTSRDSPSREDHESHAVVTPTTPEGWREWADILTGGLEKLGTADLVNAEWLKAGSVLAKAPADIREEVNAAFSERLSDIASGPAAGTDQPALDLPPGDQA